MEKVPVYIYLRIEDGAKDENGAPAPAYGSLLLGYGEKGKAPAYEDLISKVSIKDLVEAMPMLKAIYPANKISFCTPEEYAREVGEEPPSDG